MYNNQNLILSKDFSTREVINQKSTSTRQTLGQESAGRVALMPGFIKIPAIEHQDNLERAGKIIKIIAERVYQEMLAGSRGKKLLIPSKIFYYFLIYTI